MCLKQKSGEMRLAAGCLAESEKVK